MSDSVVSHPHRELMAEAQREREVIDSPEGQALLDAVLEAVHAQSQFLEQHGLIWEDGADNDPHIISKECLGPVSAIAMLRDR